MDSAPVIGRRKSTFGKGRDVIVFTDLAQRLHQLLQRIDEYYGKIDCPSCRLEKLRSREEAARELESCRGCDQFRGDWCAAINDCDRQDAFFHRLIRRRQHCPKSR